MDTNQNAPTLRPGYASMDGLDPTTGEAVPCYLMEGMRWNGWACPMFTREQGECLQFEEWTGASIRYDADQDAFVVSNAVEPGEDEVFPATVREIDGEPVTLYPIGTMSWCWDDEPDLDLNESDREDMTASQDRETASGPSM